MATTTAQATAAPIMVTLAGKEWWISPMTDEDFGIFENWVQDRYVESVRRTTVGLDERLELLARATDKAATLTIVSPEALRLMNSVPGAAMLLFLSFKHRHPDVTYEDVHKLLSDPDVLELAMAKYEKVLGPTKKKKPRRIPTRRA